MISTSGFQARLVSRRYGRRRWWPGPPAPVHALKEIDQETLTKFIRSQHELRAVPTNKSLVVVATGKYIGEGFDEPRLDTILLAMPISWNDTLAQYVGRLH